jgi:hypothetical protein
MQAKLDRVPSLRAQGSRRWWSQAGKMKQVDSSFSSLGPRLWPFVDSVSLACFGNTAMSPEPQDTIGKKPKPSGQYPQGALKMSAFLAEFIYSFPNSKSLAVFGKLEDTVS